MRTYTQAHIDSLAKPAGNCVVLLYIGKLYDPALHYRSGSASIPSNTALGWFSNGMVKTPTETINRWLFPPMPGYQAKFDEQKSNLTMGSIQFNIDNSNGQMSQLIYAALNAGSHLDSWYKREVDMYVVEQNYGTFATKMHVGRFFMKEPPNNQGLYYKFYCYDPLHLIKGSIKKNENKFTLKGKHTGNALFSMGYTHTGQIRIIDAQIDDDYYTEANQLANDPYFEDWEDVDPGAPEEWEPDSANTPPWELEYESGNPA